MGARGFRETDVANAPGTVTRAAAETVEPLKAAVVHPDAAHRASLGVECAP